MTNTNPSFADSIELSKMFHEIKNPLTLIGSSLQLIESEHPEVKTYRFWNQTIKDLHNLREFINELSDFQKVSNLQKTLISLFDFTEDLIDSTAGFLETLKISLQFECEILDLDFVGDEAKLRQAVINLIKNAAESSPAGSAILLRISADTQMLCMEVTDRGCGIGKEYLSKIFEPFHTTKSYGTGLGLPIVKRIVDSHGGRLSINSTEGAGTTVQMFLPLS
jgi:signal transduction histidine kinase